ncbi:MAG: hypothetical protein AAF226_00110, partial [Verrucomicrobiota bacterium]
VGVEAGSDGQGEALIVAWPLAEKDWSSVRVFSRVGAELCDIPLPDEIRPPFVVAVGDFEADKKGDEIAITSRFSSKAEPVMIFDTEGALVSKLTQVGSKGEQILLATESGELILQNMEKQEVHHLLPERKTIILAGAPSGRRLFESVFSDREFSLGGDESVLSTLYKWQEGELTSIDIGRRENIFWFDPQEVHNGDWATWEPIEDGQYIKNSRYNYLGAAQYWSPLFKSGEIENKSYAEWVEGIDWNGSVFRAKHRKSLDEYNSGVPTVWTAAFTHRWSVGAARKLSDRKDPNTWLSKYLLLDRKNDTTGGGYFGKRLFNYGSQNLEQTALNQLYSNAQNELYRKLAPLYRENPAMTIAVEPNHENEIVSGSQSIGDYHPKSIEGFYHYLIDLYGSLEGLNQLAGSKFTVEFFDAPRGLFRGEWDRYTEDNLLFREWIEYNRIVIYRRLAMGYQNCLLAGFPPEMIKCHQIPDSYVFGSVIGISEGDKRISPIDWLLTTGAGFGFSRYGTYYQRPHNIGQGAYSSGYGEMLIGEYASLNPSNDKALDQLLYLRDHGVAALHVMWWPSDFDKGFNKAQEWALNQLVRHHDSPKPGLAGGVTQVRSWRKGKSVYDIASLGSEEQHTGLLKSINADGTFEGSVDVVPFHSHVDIETLRNKDRLWVNPEAQTLCRLDSVRQGAVLEISFEVGETLPENSLTIDFFHRGIKLADKSLKVAELNAGQKARVVYKLPVILDGVELRLSAVNDLQLSEVLVVRHQDQAINLTKGIMEGKRHQGGVTFDVFQD